jgi:hypothetical protein
VPLEVLEATFQGGYWEYCYQYDRRTVLMRKEL